MALYGTHADWRAHTRAVLEEVFAERERVVLDEGFTPSHDDADPDPDAQALAGAAYAAAPWLDRKADLTDAPPPAWWPWDGAWFKPGLKRRNLIKALQLLTAAVCRIDRDRAREAARAAAREAAEKAAEEAARLSAVAHTPGVREFARMDVAVEVLPHVLALLPNTIKIDGSADPDAHMTGVVRLILDVTATGLQGGDWYATFNDTAARRTASFGPVDPQVRAAP